LGGIEWQWQMVYMAHGITDQVEGPIAEFCLGPQGEVRIGKKGLYFFPKSKRFLFFRVFPFNPDYFFSNK